MEKSGWICVKCGKSIKKGNEEGSMKHPYCKKCFKKSWKNNYDDYFTFLSQHN